MTGSFEEAVLSAAWGMKIAKDRQRQCHAVSLGDVKVRPPYCERLTMSEDEREGCTCCPECCSCGG